LEDGGLEDGGLEDGGWRIGGLEDGGWRMEVLFDLPSSSILFSSFLPFVQWVADNL